MHMSFDATIWDELDDKSHEEELELDITENEITADRINGELMLRTVCHGDGLTWQEAGECWPVVASCRDGNAISMICRSDRGHVAFIGVTWTKENTE